MNEGAVLPSHQLHLMGMPIEVLTDRDDLAISRNACVRLCVPARVRVRGVGASTLISMCPVSTHSSTETIGTDALGRIKNKALTEQRAVVVGLFGRIRKLDSIVDLISSLVEMAKARPELADEIAAGIRQSCWQRLEAASALELAESSVPVLSGLAGQLEADESADPVAREAVRITRGQ